MPCIGLKCPKTKMEMPFHEGKFGELPLSCIYCPDRCYSLGALSTIVGNMQDRNNQISATRLLYCMREEYLKYKFPYFTEPTGKWASVIGTAVHGAIGDALDNQRVAKAKLGYISEVRYSRSFTHEGRKVEITGQPDYISLTEQLLLDYKTTSEDYFLKALVAGEEDRVFADKMKKYSMQLNMYAWVIDHPILHLQIAWITPSNEFLSGCDYPLSHLGNRAVQGKFLEIVRKKMVKGTRSRTPEYSKATQDFYAIREKYESGELLIHIPSVKLMDETAVEKSIRYKATQLFRALEYDEMPRRCPKELIWKCVNGTKFCDVQPICKAFSD